LTLTSVPTEALDFVLEVEQLYVSLLASREPEPATEPGLGGWLLYAGDLNPMGRALLLAGNIAGAASLAVTADAAAQKQSIRDGVADFLVNSLDEALRILKNEVRKREPVAVCVGADPHAVETEMLERGVVPDLLAPDSADDAALALGGRRVVLVEAAPTTALLRWSVASSPARWLPKLDAIALDCVGSESSFEAQAARRWLRLAPRYLGRLAQNFRVLRCSTDVADAFKSNVLAAVDKQEINAAVQIEITRNSYSA
jgi:hypothetical protein